MSSSERKYVIYRPELKANWEHRGIWLEVTEMRNRNISMDRAKDKV